MAVFRPAEMDTALTSKEAADYLGVSHRRVQALITSKLLRARRFSYRWVIRIADLRAVGAMHQDKAGASGKPVLPIKEFGSYALAEYRQGSLIRTEHETFWFPRLPALEAIQSLPPEAVGAGPDWLTLVAYATSKPNRHSAGSKLKSAEKSKT
ncbi:MAG: helix-turn-helix domain-containing protein [Blastocatellia bacterium]